MPTTNDEEKLTFKKEMQVLQVEQWAQRVKMCLDKHPAACTCGWDSGTDLMPCWDQQ